MILVNMTVTEKGHCGVPSVMSVVCVEAITRRSRR